MKTAIDHIANGIFFMLGLMHTVLTLVNQRPFDLDALMYVGAGLAFLFLSALNYSRTRLKFKLTSLLSLMANTAATAYIVLIALVFSDPRVAVALVALSVLVFLSASDYRSAADT